MSDICKSTMGAEDVAAITEMIRQLRRGNFNHRITHTDPDKAAHGIVESLNLLARELGWSAHSQSKMKFILDKDFNIRTVTPAVSKLLRFTDDNLKGRPFASLLTGDSRLLWEVIKSHLLQGRKKRCSYELSFFTRDDTACVVTGTTFGLLYSRHHNEIMYCVKATPYCKEQAPAREDGYAEEEQATQDGYMPPRMREDLEYVMNARDYILKHFADPLKIPDLEMASGLNKSKLQEGFKRLLGTTVFSFVTRVRVEHAKTFLRDTNMPLKMIAKKVGYSLPQFTKVFRKETGITPGSYRNSPVLDTV